MGLRVYASVRQWALMIYKLCIELNLPSPTQNKDINKETVEQGTPVAEEEVRRLPSLS